MDIDEKIINIIKEELSIEHVTPEMELEKIEINSIGFIKIIVAIETEFDFEFEDEKMLFSAFPKIEDIIHYTKLKTYETKSN